MDTCKSRVAGTTRNREYILSHGMGGKSSATRSCEKARELLAGEEHPVCGKKAMMGEPLWDSRVRLSSYVYKTTNIDILLMLTNVDGVEPGSLAISFYYTLISIKTYVLANTNTCNLQYILFVLSLPFGLPRSDSRLHYF